MVWCFGSKSKSKKDGKALGPRVVADEKADSPPSFRTNSSTDELPCYMPREQEPIMISISKEGSMRTCTVREYRKILKKQKDGTSLIAWQNRELQEQFANIDVGYWSAEKRLQKERELLRKLQETNGNRQPIGRKEFCKNFENDVGGKSLKPRMWFMIDKEELYRKPQLTRDDAASVNSF